ncbi:di-trans,poly-cis-decaprenylcistransferase [Candidatus Saccharibacteria bacterium]|nr:di-trans,poly-cis-decaprenylcistransferase [Candidatus Saccharibacteria bacterium]MBI3338400.1 di-trans,poly-cis-decaprenylcistransferase [Candidatus Saccharibacteria bacterium]
MSETNTVPVHLGLILDGNRRWAKANGLPAFEGHRRGYENLKTIGKTAIKRGVKYISAYVFSTENWQRSKEEVDYLMKLLLWVAKHEVAEMNKDGIRVRFMGSRDRLSAKILRAIDEAEIKTKDNVNGTLALCLNYGGRQEIVEAFQKMAANDIATNAINEQTIADNLYQPDIPPVDLIIRTSGEQRISNFMLWRAAYSELYFTDVHWPDFNEAELDKALEEYAARHRRYGK